VFVCESSCTILCVRIHVYIYITWLYTYIYVNTHTWTPKHTKVVCDIWASNDNTRAYRSAESVYIYIIICTRKRMYAGACVRIIISCLCIYYYYYIYIVTVACSIYIYTHNIMNKSRWWPRDRRGRPGVCSCVVREGGRIWRAGVSAKKYIIGTCFVFPVVYTLKIRLPVQSFDRDYYKYIKYTVIYHNFLLRYSTKNMKQVKSYTLRTLSY